MCSTTSLLLLISLSKLLTAAVAHFQPCTDDFLKLTEPRNLSNCKPLHTLSAEFAWQIRDSTTPNSSTSPPTSIIDIAFGTRLTEGLVWLAWGVNPGKMAKMVGTRALIGIVQTNGSLAVAAYNVTRQAKMFCGLNPSVEPDPLVGFRDPRFEYRQDYDYYVIHATVAVAKKGEQLRLNHVWQLGYDAVGMSPRMHPTTLQHFDSTETLNLVTSQSTDFGHLQRHLRMVHGVLSIIGWGTLLPAGAIMVRYLRYPFQVQEHWWFYPHLTCQVVGYSLGTASWILGLYLGKASNRYIFKTHRLYSIFIFTFATLQMLAIKLRPLSTDRYKRYWNMYHHFMGYGLLSVIVINIFQGIGILRPAYSWKWAYVGILAALGIVVLALETYTWIKFFRPDPHKNAHAAADDSVNNPHPSDDNIVNRNSSQKPDSSAVGPSPSSAPSPAGSNIL
ncbi:unnamed protein product [Linum tenue]|uniref:Cytochrome b561 domain-containing protein n=1 Tax=Linum tenue TaxID=586396 RepID=A0AAV0H2C7_9ROSI|nr:unnamed protein product [Linum tenue]